MTEFGQISRFPGDGHPEDKPDKPLDGGNDKEDSKQVINPKGIHAEFLEMKAYYLKYEYREKDMTWGISMILICTLLIVICLVLNMTVFKFYRKKAKNDVVSLLYSLMSFADIMVAVGATLTVACLILYLALNLETKDRDFVYPSVEYLCYSSFFISSIAIRISIFLNAMLSIVRTIMIRDPFSEPNKRGICLALGLATFFWTMMTAGEVYTQKTINIELHWSAYVKEKRARFTEEDAKNRKQYLYMWYYIYTSAAGFYHIVEFFDNKLPWSIGLYDRTDKMGKIAAQDVIEQCALYGTFLIAFIVPCLIAIACLILKAIYLKKSNIDGTENNNKKVTNTIIMLTLVFVICNTINIVIISVAMFYPDWMESGSSEATAQEDLHRGETSKASRLETDDPTRGNRTALTTSTRMETNDEVIIRFYRTMFAVQQLLPLLNSAVSPMILIWRGSALKTFFQTMFCKRPQMSFSSRLSQRTVSQ